MNQRAHPFPLSNLSHCSGQQPQLPYEDFTDYLHTLLDLASACRLWRDRRRRFLARSVDVCRHPRKTSPLTISHDPSGSANSAFEDVEIALATQRSKQDFERERLPGQGSSGSSSSNRKKAAAKSPASASATTKKPDGPLRKTRHHFTVSMEPERVAAYRAEEDPFATTRNSNKIARSAVLPHFASMERERLVAYLARKRSL
ncbi:hypothetical protein DFS34DRAFT_647631 [Phlyctochytrium arcticum]|nr:hypothetical protein DFS34DRAFT_647631 [Phlyctochytrium arcticum]